jgi:hypothetical protein
LRTLDEAHHEEALFAKSIFFMPLVMLKIWDNTSIVPVANNIMYPTLPYSDVDAISYD